MSGKIYEIEETPFSDLDEDNRIAVEELLEDNINEFMIHKTMSRRKGLAGYSGLGIERNQRCVLSESRP